MCSSLKDGGLRCSAHVIPQLEALKKEYSDGLVADAIKSGVPVDEALIESKMDTFTSQYLAKEAANKEEQEAVKQQLLVAHASAMEAKEAAEAETENLDGYSSLEFNGSLKETLQKKFSSVFPSGPVKAIYPSLAELNDKPAFKTFPDKEEYVETKQLVNGLNKRMDKQHFKMQKSIRELNEQRRDQLHVTNPELKKLRKKANISDFFSTENSYSAGNAYSEALRKVENREMVYANENDFPQLKQRMYQDRISLGKAEANLRELRTGYIDHCSKPENHVNGVPSSINVDSMINNAPDETPSIAKLQYKAETRKFQKLKKQYVELGSKEYNVDKAKEQHRAEMFASKTPPFDKQKMKEFRRDVHDKKPEVIKLKESIKQKSHQLNISPAYRSGLKSQAARAFRNGNTLRSDSLLEKKRKLDGLAAIEEGKNRLKSLAV